jgi:membrane-associated phospholipid phosphatase
MKHLIGLFLLFSIGISAQEITKDTITKKDTTIIQKLGKIVQVVVKDTVPRKETEKDSLVEKKLDGKFYGFRQFEHETFLFVETPARWHKTDWLRFGLVLTATAVTMSLDHTFNYVTQTHQSYYYTAPVIIGKIYGEWYFTGTLTAISVGYTLITHNTEAKKGDIELIQAAVYSEALTAILKTSIGRASPNAYKGAFYYKSFSLFKTNFESMPSSDAALAFALSIITFKHTTSTLLKVLAFVPATFTLFSRIYQNDHWASDEFFGAAIGFCTGEWVVNLHEGKRHKINIPVKD